MRNIRRITGSVRVRVTVLATVLVAVVLVVGALMLTHAVEKRLVSDRERAAESALGDTLQQVQQGVPFDSIVPGPLDQGAGVGIFNVETGAPVAGVSGPITNVRVLAAGPGAGERDYVFVSSNRAPGDITFRAAPVSGGQYVVVGMASLAEVRHSIHTLWSGLRLGIPLVVLAVAIVAWFLAGRALRPVESMLVRLQAARDHERQFLSDASHELRSPLASMRAQLETGDWPDHATGVRAEADRLAHIVDDLVDLAKADESAPPTTETDLDEVVLEEAGAIATTAATEIRTADVGAARLIGDRPALARMVRNLVENAARHAGSIVDIGLVENDGRITLTVDDDGDGVPAADRQRIFERFTRTDSSRSRDTGGVGLGLAVVRATARRHGGEVLCLDSPLGGARFEVSLPGAP
jgi:signal transduction histidine kinase